MYQRVSVARDRLLSEFMRPHFIFENERKRVLK